jgi:putative transcriptional regulator
VIILKNHIRETRKSLKLSQEELAKRCGVTRQTINAIENDKYDPTLALAFKLAKNLNVKIDELFTFEEGIK